MKNNKHLKVTSWNEMQDNLAAENSAAIVLLHKDNSVRHESNNNSICQTLYSSKEFAPECEKFCGSASKMAEEAGETVEYECYAGLICRAVLLETKEEKQFVAIVGRTFTKAATYRQATERSVSGDWNKFPPTKFFENVLLKSSANDLNTVIKSLESFNKENPEALNKLNEREKPIQSDKAVEKPDQSKIPVDNQKTAAEIANLDQLISQFNEANAQTSIVSEKINQINSSDAEEFASWRSLFSSLYTLSYKQACNSILRFISEHYDLNSLAWLERRENRLVTVQNRGELNRKQIKISLSTDDKILKKAIQDEISLELRENNFESKNSEPQQILQLFPITVGNEVRSGLVVGDADVNKKKERQIVRFCQNIASELEILRLREEVTRRGWLAQAVQKFNQHLDDIDSDDFWSRLTQISAELMRAERGSLLLLDEKSDNLILKAAIGNNADAIRNETKNLGERVARQVLNSGKSLVVPDIDKIGLLTAPPDWKYKSKSFISYPLTIGSRKIGVLNLTDKIDGENYTEFDLELLNSIVPQFAVLIDRAALKHKAGEFEQLSVTDALTGLLNRRYLEERLAEEIKRSNRHGFPMSFMMIDVDDFKSYNDNFSHPEGDRALRIVAESLKDTLRGADIAARYGGEEFSILLPQTTSDEAKIIAERIREKVATTAFPNRQVTISLGIASCSQIICNPHELISAADKALYRAKNAGRNNVQVFEELADSKKHSM